jgi:ABC-type lipoprotein export system ATPase subunit
MLTKLVLRNFKLFENVEIELGERVVFVGPNNSGKSSALQSLALWSTGVKRWVEKHKNESVTQSRTGAVINRKDLTALPVPSANLLWRSLNVRQGKRLDGKRGTENVLIDIEVTGITDGHQWFAPLEFDFANAESFHCRAKFNELGKRVAIPNTAAELTLAYLPAMSGLAASEARLDEGAIAVRIGEGRTAEVLRNLCWLVHQRGEAAWIQVTSPMEKLFGIQLEEPTYDKSRGEISLAFRQGRVSLDLSASGRGQQQTLLLLAHMAAHPGAVILLDEPDAHLEILRQRQVYDLLVEVASQTRSQLIIATHSEVILNEAAGRDLVVAFVGKPHRIDDRGSQVLKSLKEIGYEQYLLAEQCGWVLYLEGATDLHILRSLARKLGHPAADLLEKPFVHYVGNQPPKAREHFYGLREAKSNLRGLALYDNLRDKSVPDDPNLTQVMWRKREIENYFVTPEVLKLYASEVGSKQSGELFASSAIEAMNLAISDVTSALEVMKKKPPFDDDSKTTDDFLDLIFPRFFKTLGLPEGTMRKTGYHDLSQFLSVDKIDFEVTEKLNAIVLCADRAKTSQPS